MNVAKIPKVELHLHLEGAAPPTFIKQLAHEKKMDIGGVFDADGNYAFDDFPHFLKVYEAATSVLKSPEDYARLTLAVLEESAKDGAIYSEVFMSPDFCGGGDVGAWKEYLHATQEAANTAETKFDILLRGIVTCVRHFGPDKAKASALCAAETAGDWVVGFGMGGDECMGRQSDFAYAFDMAREAGLGLTTHAGEFEGADSVKDALRNLRVTRIGHGVRAIEDAALVREIVDHEITLEICPGSNVALGVYPDVKSHPIEKLRNAGVKVTVSTDDPPFFRTSLHSEYDMLNSAFGWDHDVFMEINKTAANAAFCDTETRLRVLKKLETT